MAHVEVMYPCPVCRVLFDTADMISCRAPGYNEARALLEVTRQELRNASRKEDELLIWPNTSQRNR